jgi:hypothetical protein
MIECLVSLSRDVSSYERDHLLSLLAKTYPHESAGQQLERLQQLVNAELLIPMSRNNTLQLNKNVRQFVESVLHEHQLGLSDILKARITDIKTGLEQLQQALQERDIGTNTSTCLWIMSKDSLTQVNLIDA